MSDEGRIQLPSYDDVEEMLEILMKIAQSEGREFLAYLLSMALMEPATSLARRHIFRTSRTIPDFPPMTA